MMSSVTPSSTPWWRPFWTLGRKILTAYLVIVVVLAMLQRKLLYSPRTADSLVVAEHPEVAQLYPAAEDVELQCADGVSIRGWLLRKSTTRSDRPLVIYMHGNAGHRGSRSGWYELLEESGCDVLAIDYHGYGDSGGSISQTALEMDCDAAWEFAVEHLGYHHRQIVLLGTSLGGAAVVYLGAKQSQAGTPPQALVTVATFSSMVDVGSSIYPWLPVRFVLVDRFPSDQRIPNVECPVLLLHGDADHLVKQQFGRKLFDAAPQSSSCGVDKRWVNLPGVGHDNIIYDAGDRILQEFTSMIQDARQAQIGDR